MLQHASGELKIEQSTADALGISPRLAVREVGIMRHYIPLDACPLIQEAVDRDRRRICIKTPCPGKGYPNLPCEPTQSIVRHIPGVPKVRK